MIDHTTPGAVHTAFGVSRLTADGRVDAHVHSFEESFYVLDGSVIVETPEATVELVPGDYGMIPIGLPHAWRNDSGGDASWADLMTPQPRPWFDGDTYFVPVLPEQKPIPVDPRDPRTRSFGHIAPENMDPGRQSQDLLAVSASMRTALLVYTGITVKMMSDTDLGAQLSTMFMVQYDPRGGPGFHDHPLEETYYILDGEVEAWFDGEQYLLEGGRRRLRRGGGGPCFQQRHRDHRALAGDAGAGPSGATFLPLRKGLGLSDRASRRGMSSVLRQRNTVVGDAMSGLLGTTGQVVGLG